MIERVVIRGALLTALLAMAGCGPDQERAGDLQAVPILVGLGVDELSVSVPTVPAVKAGIRSRSLDECKALAQQALAQDTAANVRALVPLDF